MKDFKSLTDNQLRLVRTSLLWFKGSMKNLRIEFKFDQNKMKEIDVVISMCNESIKDYEDELIKRHADFSFRGECIRQELLSK